MGEDRRKRVRICQRIQEGERIIQRGAQEVEALSYKAEMIQWSCTSVHFYFQLIPEVEADNTVNGDKDLITSTTIICKFV